MKKLDHPLVSYILIAVVSLGSAVILFLLGGSLAEVTGNEANALGFGFKAGGGIAGFILIFVLSQRAVNNFQERSRDQSINIKVYLQAKPNNFQKSTNTFTAEYTIFNEDTGERRTFNTNPFWEAGFLTIQVREVGEKDFLSIRIMDGANNTWESDSFHSRSPKIAEVSQLQ